MNRHELGYPDHLVSQVICNSNALLTMSGMLLALIGSNETAREWMAKIQPGFADCLSALLPSGS